MTLRVSLFVLCFLLSASPTVAKGYHRDPVAGGSFEVLVVGDSWSEFFWVNRSLRTVFSAQGHSDSLEKGDATTISGSTAAEWTAASQLQLITDELNAHPSIGIIQLTIGGNDFLAGAAENGWFSGISPADEQALINRILGDVETVINHILNLDSRYTVLLSFYDFPNFEESLSGILALSCINLHNGMNQPTTQELNAAFNRFSQQFQQLEDLSSRVHLVQHSGLMQYHFGVPNQNIPPKTILPPGDPNYPSPIQAMFLGADCIHLNSSGYQIVAENLWNQFYIDQFCVTSVSLFQQLSIWPGNSVLRITNMVNRQCP